MNPLLFKAHPFLLTCLTLLTEPTTLSQRALLGLCALLILGCIPFALGLRWLLQRSEGFRPGILEAGLLTLPANLLYTPLMLTLMQDVVHHTFLLQDRWFLLFTLVVASQLLTALYAFALRNPTTHAVLGVESGLGASLLMLLIAMGLSLGLVLLELKVPIF